MRWKRRCRAVRAALAPRSLSSGRDESAVEAEAESLCHVKTLTGFEKNKKLTQATAAN